MAAAVVATARGLRGLEATEKALQAGVVSFDQAQVIVRTTTDLGEAAGQAEQVLLDHAPGLDTARFRQFAREVAYRADPDAAEEREKKRWDKRHLSFGLTLNDTGSAVGGVRGRGGPMRSSAPPPRRFAPPGGQLDTRTAAQRRMDGLVAACKAALDGGSAPERHGAAPHVSILVHDENPRPGRGPGRGREPGRRARPGGGARACRPTRSPVRRRQTGHGTLLTARQVLALCCGAQVGADPLARRPAPRVGRTARTEPPGLRRALEARDRGCRWTACDALAAWATAHHIKTLEQRRRHQPAGPGPVLPPAPPLLHPPAGLDRHWRPQRHPPLHPPRRHPDPGQPTARAVSTKNEGQ